VLAVADPELHHVGVAVTDVRAAIASYAQMFGYELLHGPVDDPGQRVTVAFVGAAGGGGLQYELVAPLAGARGSPIDRILSGSNSSYHLCYQVSDLEQSLSRFRQAGCTSIGKPGPAVAFGGRRIAWLLTPTNHLLELLEARVRIPPTLKTDPG
jgi:methylmalonyl-CoA/ethylmalonyl-CoA epimerase